MYRKKARPADRAGLVGGGRRVTRNRRTHTRRTHTNTITTLSAFSTRLLPTGFAPVARFRRIFQIPPCRDCGTRSPALGPDRRATACRCQTGSLHHRLPAAPPHGHRPQTAAGHSQPQSPLAITRHRRSPRDVSCTRHQPQFRGRLLTQPAWPACVRPDRQPDDPVCRHGIFAYTDHGGQVAACRPLGLAVPPVRRSAGPQIAVPPHPGPLAQLASAPR